MLSQLPDDPIKLAAAAFIERELQLTPWNLTHNFVSALAQVWEAAALGVSCCLALS